MQTNLFKAIQEAYRMDENLCLEPLLKEAKLSSDSMQNVESRARSLVESVRRDRLTKGGLDAFLHQYDLSSEEGIALMCLAEALLRIPDANTSDRLIKDKIASQDWEQYLGKSQSWFVNAATWGLMLTGKLLTTKKSSSVNLLSALKRLVARTGEPIIRNAVRQAMKILGRQFVMAEDIQAALDRAKESEARGYRYSYDMLGEAAKTKEDAAFYLKSYQDAIEAIGKVNKANGDKGPIDGPGVSVKLSALHPRYEWAKREQMQQELLPILKSLVLQAKEANIGFTIDAEEADRLELSLLLFEAVVSELDLGAWQGLGLALQAYQKRAFYVIDWLAALAKRYQRRFMLRLVKGAYWDSEIKWTQERGLKDYPVFTRKSSTDVSFLACAQKIFKAGALFYPQFASHNAQTVSAIIEMAKLNGMGMPDQSDSDKVEQNAIAGQDKMMGQNAIAGQNTMTGQKNNIAGQDSRMGQKKDMTGQNVRASQYEFQCLHGMGESLYDNIIGENKLNIPCRVYAPVGGHEHLLGYLVRRLLENGANTSFVNRIIDEQTPIDLLVEDPVTKTEKLTEKRHPKIPLPKDLYGKARPNSRGLDLSDSLEMDPMLQAISKEFPKIFKKDISAVNMKDIPAAANTTDLAVANNLATIFAESQQQVSEWNQISPEARAQCLERMAGLLDTHRSSLMALIIREGGRTVMDANSELREAIDFCWYYSERLRRDFPVEVLTGPAGEYNQLTLQGRGVFACISPWNFPLAIYLGQVLGALAAGNVVIAKPASQTPRIALAATALLHEAGFPKAVVHCVVGSGSSIGKYLLESPALAGVMLTGSTDTARVINRTLASREGPILPFIAETGGQNAMIVDSSALPEQVVTDVITSAFNSAGQRCSALRVLFIQEEVASRIIHMLKGAMMELKIGDPFDLATDVGPVIDQKAAENLIAHVEGLKRASQLESGESTSQGENWQAGSLKEASSLDRAVADQASSLNKVSNLKETSKAVSKTVSRVKTKLIYECPLPENLPVLERGVFFAPVAFEIDNIEMLTQEVFGPVLHVIRYQSSELNKVVEAINNTGYGLTLGIHSRISEVVEWIVSQARVGNIYVNRNMIGAVVGVQPFGGEGLSGTGPKAGGPHMLPRLTLERSLSINTAAAGGNVALMSLSE